MRTVVSLKPVRESRDSITDIWGQRTPHRGEWPVRVDERITEEPDRWVQSTCVLCSTGCALDIGVKDNRIVGVRGRAIDRVNKGRLGPKGLHGWVANESADRIGKPGSTVFQMNGQPTAQNTRECGANGELVAFLNYKYPDHVALIARHWNVDPQSIPHHGPPTHAMNIFRHAEEGSIRMLWIVGTNPAVSLPELSNSQHPEKIGAVCGRAGRVLGRDGRARRPRLARRDLGGEDRLFHERRSDGAYFPQGY